jgi:serine/threonine protein kinase
MAWARELKVVMNSPPSYLSDIPPLAYSPPELFQAPDYSFSLATDIYALGATFFSLLTGREPFSDIRNPAHQLWSIRRGFWESGANPLMPSQTGPLSAGPRTTVFSSKSLPPQLLGGVMSTIPVSAPVQSCSSPIVDVPLLMVRMVES